MWHRNNTYWKALAWQNFGIFHRAKDLRGFGPAVAILPERLDLSLREDAVTIGIHLILCERESINPMVFFESAIGDEGRRAGDERTKRKNMGIG